MAVCLQAHISSVRAGLSTSARKPRSRQDVIAQAAVHCKEGYCRSRTYERVLRYPDGAVRTIRYPVVETEDEFGSEAWSLAAHSSDCDTVAAQPRTTGPEHGGSAATSSTAGTAHSPSARDASMLSSPAALLQYFSSPEFKERKKQEQLRIRGSYQVYEGCPWLISRPVFVLSSAGEDNDAAVGQALTFRTAIAKQDVADELSKLLKRASAGAFIDVNEVRDGIVTFEDEDDAEQFSTFLQANDNLQMVTVRMDAHALWRSTAAVRAVVVLLRATSADERALPQPHELRAALLDSRPLDECL